MNNRKNEQGIAIIIVIAIMVALIMITTALLGTVTRVGETARSYKYESMLRMAALSTRAHVINKIAYGADAADITATTDNATPMTISSLALDPTIKYFSQSFEYEGTAETAASFYKLQCRFFILDLESCIYLPAAYRAGETEKKVYTELIGNLDKAGYSDDTTTFFGTEMAINTFISNYKLNPLPAEADARFYTFNDIGALINPDKIVESSLLFSPYGEVVSPMKYDVHRVPNWIIGSMVGNCQNSTGLYREAMSDLSLEAIVKKIVEMRNEQRTIADIVSEVYNTAGYTDNNELDPASAEAKKNAAIETFVYGLFGSAATKSAYMKEKNAAINEAEAPCFSGRLVNKNAGADSQPFYRVMVYAELINIAKDEAVAAKNYEFVYDRKDKKVTSSRWFEVE